MQHLLRRHSHHLLIQPDQSLRCPQEETLRPELCEMRPVNILIRFVNAQADLNLRSAHMSEGTFSHVAAHELLKFDFYMNPNWMNICKYLIKFIQN